MALEFLAFIQSRGMDGGSSPLWVYHPLSPLPTCVVGTSRVSFLCLGVCQGSGTSKRSGQDAAERSLGTSGPPGPRYYSRLFLVEKATGWCSMFNLLSLNRYVTYQVQDGNGLVSTGVNQERRLHVLDRPQGRLLPDTHSPYLSTSPDPFRGQDTVYQLKVPSFDLLTATQVFTRVFTLVLQWAHRKGISLHYLDDWLVMAELVPLLLQHREQLLLLCQDLGFVINWGESQNADRHHMR